MKRNILIALLSIILSIVLIYPFGYILNQFVFNQQGGGFDVGPDSATINIFVGAMAIPPLLMALIFGIWGKDKWKWIFAIILSLLSIYFFKWAGIYLIIPFISFGLGLLIVVLISKLYHPNPR